MRQWKSKKERLGLGARAVNLRDVKKLKWAVIAERLGVSSPELLRVYYNKYKASLLAVPLRLSLEKVEAFAEKSGFRRNTSSCRTFTAWVWLYENGYRHRVPAAIQEKIEETKVEWNR